MGLAAVARRTGHPQHALVARALGLPSAASVRSAGLIVDGGHAPVPPTPVVKWKTPPADAARLNEFRRASPTTAVRLDGNQQLTLAAATLLADVVGERLQFVEEPGPPGLLAACARRFPVALDESLVDLDLDVDDALQIGARCLVLKPATLGPARTLELGRAARRAGLDVVISAVGEGPAGLRALVALHAVLGTLDAGLGTWRQRDDTRALFADDGAFVGPLP
jgi:hypothetical protein